MNLEYYKDKLVQVIIAGRDGGPIGFLSASEASDKTDKFVCLTPPNADHWASKLISKNGGQNSNHPIHIRESEVKLIFELREPPVEDKNEKRKQQDQSSGKKAVG